MLEAVCAVFVYRAPELQGHLQAIRIFVFSGRH